MDTTQLITMGKIAKKIKLGDYEFQLETPTASQITDSQENIVVAAHCIIQITDTKKKESETFNTPESKEKLIGILRSMQGGLVSKIIEECNELASTQEKLIGELAGGSEGDSKK